MSDFFMEREEIDFDQDRFRITDVGKLSWAIRKIKALRAKQDEVREMVAAEIARLEAWEAREVSMLDESEMFFTALVTEYLRERRAEDPDFKSLKTPNGSAGFRRQSPEYVYDDKKLVNFLSSGGYSDLYEEKRVPIKTEIKKRFTVDGGRLIDAETGAIVEGVEVKERGEKIDIKF